MIWTRLTFVLAAGTTLVGAVLAVGLKNIFHNILGFALALVGVAGLFLILGSDFLAAVLVLVYVGALAIAMVYAVMLSYPLDAPTRPRSVPKILASVALALLVAATLWLVVAPAHFWLPPAPKAVRAADAGALFLTNYVLAFELISVLLVVAMMGAVRVAKKARERRAAR